MPQDAPDTTLAAPPRKGIAALMRSRAALVGSAFLLLMLLACLGSLPWTIGAVVEPGSARGVPRYNAGSPDIGRLPPFWVTPTPAQAQRLNRQVPPSVVREIAVGKGATVEDVYSATSGLAADAMREHWPRYTLGTDVLGRSLLVRCLVGGGVSLVIGLAAALLSVLIGTLYGALAGYAGGRTDAVMMRIVDVLYGLPYVLLVVLLAVAGDALLDEHLSRNRARTTWTQEQALRTADERGIAAGRSPRERAEALLRDDTALRAQLQGQALVRYPPRQVSAGTRTIFDLVTLLVAIGGVSWLTMARVIRGQVLSLKARPFIEAARAIGVS